MKHFATVLCMAFAATAFASAGDAHAVDWMSFGRWTVLVICGMEYETVLQDGNIKFVKMRNPNDSVRVPEETRSKGRIYVTIGKNGDLKSITRYDEDGKKVLQIDLSHAHTSGGVRLQPHSHDGYNHAEGRPLTTVEERLVNHILKTWREYNANK